MFDFDFIPILKTFIYISVPVAVFLAFVYFGTPLLKALPLFFKDVFKKIIGAFKGKPKPFDMYGVYLYNGLGGNGKTISMVNKAVEIKQKYPKVLIMGNFHSAVIDKYFDKWEDILNTENIDENGVNQGVLILFDEMHLTLNSQGWRNAPDELLEYISLQRHLHKCIFGSAQDWSRISKIIREQVNYIIDCKAYFCGRLIMNKCYTKENFMINGEQKSSGVRKRPKEWKQCFVATDELRSMYNTDEIVKGLKLSAQDTKDKIANRLLYNLE